MTINELRDELIKINKENGMPINQMAREMNIAFITLSDFMKIKRNPTYGTILKMKEFIVKNHGK